MEEIHPSPEVAIASGSILKVRARRNGTMLPCMGKNVAPWLWLLRWLATEAVGVATPPFFNHVMGFSRPNFAFGSALACSHCTTVVHPKFALFQAFCTKLKIGRACSTWHVAVLPSRLCVTPGTPMVRWIPKMSEKVTQVQSDKKYHQ